ncbi:major facilitator superfamily domain-containing protein 12-like isoform X1 [Acropora millepora]|uniref:major facilitator superfamily domain-containing protein 12-like isoform X1 n=2 Tax=Acropora millepora TaxID=45264 RepID=UPI001CF5BF32|nr:major facilitator superfamily domain-containing protein 12-like isoform X1 [Acropora millepora]XP_029203900.2 major facilitator superfamily domain-containing protein 12-like isoform X1 [Acropora millepora]
MVGTSEDHPSCFGHLAYGVGQVINDATRRLLSSTGLVFLMKVVRLSAPNAGWIILYTRLIGALILRPVVGYLCDRVHIPVLSQVLGKRKSWHLVGIIVTVIFVPLLYATCFACGNEPSQWKMMLYYCTIATFVMFAICCIEIAHLSFISAATKDQNEAAKLNAIRTATMYLTGIFCYLVVLAVLGQDNHNQITPESAMDFTMIAIILAWVGLVFASVFLVGTKEPEELAFLRSPEPTHADNSTSAGVFEMNISPNRPTSNSQGRNTHNSKLPEACRQGHGTIDLITLTEKKTLTAITKAMPSWSARHQFKAMVTNVQNLEPKRTGKSFAFHSLDPESGSQTQRHKKVREWLKDPHLYKVAFLYTSTKVLQDISYYYLPLFLIETITFEKKSIAYLPLGVLLSATLSTGLTKKLVDKIGSKVSFVLACLVVIGAAALFYITPQFFSWLIYPAAVLLGFGFSAMFVNAFNFANELVGANKNTSGFVFSFLGTIASLTGGIVVILIQIFYPEESVVSEDCKECGIYVCHVLSLVPGSLALLSLLVVLLF